MDANLRVRPKRIPGSDDGFAVVLRFLLLSALCLALASCSTGGVPFDDSEGEIHGAVLVYGQSSNGDPSPAAGDYLTAASRDVPVAPLASIAQEQAGAFVPGQVLVQYRDRDVVILAGSAEGQVPGAPAGPVRTELQPTETLESVEEAIARLTGEPDVRGASPNYYLYPTAELGDPYFVQQWSLPAAGVPQTKATVAPAAEAVVVAVIDTGFDLSHEDLSHVFLPGYDFCADAQCGSTDDDPGHGSPNNWHGTHVAGLIAAEGHNGLGVRGIASGAAVRILPVKIFNDEGVGANTDVLIRALRWAAGLAVEGAPLNQNPARIINLSIAGDFPSSILQSAIDEVSAAGALVVASTGNEGLDRVMSPAAAENVLGVGAVNSHFRRSCFSNFGTGSNGPGGVDLVAPGGEADGSHIPCGVEQVEVHGLISTIPGNGYASAVGTSMAAPLVSGSAALLLANDPSVERAELAGRLIESAYRDQAWMDELGYGAGLLRVDRAFGLTGPGDSILLELSAHDSGPSYSSTVTLGLTVSSGRFFFSDVPAGNYSLRALASDSGEVIGSVSVPLHPGEEREAVLVLGQTE